MNSIDLTDLARGYRHRPPTETALERARHAGEGRRGVFLDIGGGTGAHAQQWVRRGVQPIVVDPSGSMCAQAAVREGVSVLQAVSQKVPLHDDVAALVYFHLSIHYGLWEAAVDEALRVVAPDGVVEIWTFAPESMRASALARWFPRVGDIDARRFPPIESLAERLASSGAHVSVARVPETVERTAASWRAAVRNRFVSTIQLLTDAEIDDGLDRFAKVYGVGDALYRYVIEFVRIRAANQPLACGE